MTKSYLRTAAIPLLLILSSCGGDASSPTSTPVPTAPTRANLQVTLVGSPVLSFGTVRNFALSYSIRVTESGGVGANMNFIRLEARIGTISVERQEIGAQTIIAQAGTNRIEARGSRDFNISQEFNNGNADNVLLTISFTDDRGNPSSHQITVTF